MKKQLTCSLPVIISREGKHYIAYSPALDLSSAGKTQAEATRHFHEAAEAFFEEVIEMGTLKEVLTQLGWQKTKTTFQPPKIVKKSTVRVKAPVL